MFRLLLRDSGVKEYAAAQDRCRTSAVGEDAEVADANESLGQDVEEESAQELIGGDGHHLLLAAVSVVLPAKRDLPFAKGYKPVVGDGDAMGVACELVEHMLSSAEGRLGKDDPLLRIELS
jgi:hypothetical protein